MNNSFGILVTKVAKIDIENISDYIAKDNKKAATYMVDIFYETFKFLSDYPEAGCKKNDIKDNSIRIFTIKKNFSIVYRIKDNKIEILRILTRFQNIFAILN